MRAHLIASDDGKPPPGRQGREGRDFLSPLEQQPFHRNIHVHEGRPRAYARVGKNNRDVFSRPSRPTRPGGSVVDLRPIAWRRYNREYRRLLFQRREPDVLQAERPGARTARRGAPNCVVSSMSGRRSRDKGSRTERAIARLLLRMSLAEIAKRAA